MLRTFEELDGFDMSSDVRGVKNGPETVCTFNIVTDGDDLENFRFCYCVEKRVHTAQLEEVLLGYHIACYFRQELEGDVCDAEWHGAGRGEAAGMLYFDRRGAVGQKNRTKAGHRREFERS
jgi:hypothetical protein